jgi:ATP-binding cassette, subfamily B, bacterial
MAVAVRDAERDSPRHGPLHPARAQWLRWIRLLRYALRYRAGWSVIFLATVLSTLFAVVTPWPMKVLVDNVLGNVPLPPLLTDVSRVLPGADSRGGLIKWVALAGLAIYGLSSALEALLTWLWIRVGQATVYDLTADLFARIQRRSLLFHTRSSVGDSMARITGDSWAVHILVNALLFAPLQAGLTGAVILVLMFRLNTTLTLLSLAVVPVIALKALRRGNRIRTTVRAHRELESRIVSHVQQTLNGVPVVQAFAQEHREAERFVQLTDAALRAMRQSILARNVAGLGYGFLTKLGLAAVLWVGARQVLNGSLTVGSLLVFLAYLRSLKTQLKAFSTVYTNLQTVSAKVDRVCEVLEAEPELVERTTAVPINRSSGRVVFDNVTFGYEPTRAVLKNISFEALPGDTVAIIGPSGAGKTTLAGLIPRFFDPWEGRVMLDGHDLRDLQVKALRDQMSVVLQEPFLFPMTIAQNISYGCPSATSADIEWAAKAANADAFIRRLPDGYGTPVGSRGATLSGGERQRLSIARALLKQAPILILDEPTSALDPATEHLIVEALGRLMRGRTTFVIAHRLSTIRRASKILVVEAGRIREAGDHEQLQQRGGLYARWHATQSRQDTLNLFAAEPAQSGDGGDGRAGRASVHQ